MRYIARSWIADDTAWATRVAPDSVAVIVDEGLVKTGLLDASGIPLYRFVGLQNVGFIKMGD